MVERPARHRLRRFGTVCVTATAVIISFWATGCMERLFYHPTRAATVAPPEVSGAQSVNFTSSDGTLLHGWFIPATDGTPVEQAATILHVHGNAGNIEGHIWFTQFLPAAGFNLFIFDFRGYGRSEGTARQRGPLIADTNAAVDELLSRPDVDAASLGLFAHSLGGAIGLNVMAERPELRCAVVMSAFSSWRDIAADAVGGNPPGPVSRFMARVLIKDDHRADVAIGSIDRPILIIHGTDDRIVPARHGRRLAEAGPTAQLIEIDGGDHNDMRSSHPEVDDLVIDFFRRTLGRP
jgi:pimeloyl-ACP methyl ester carboxylesterase